MEGAFILRWMRAVRDLPSRPLEGEASELGRSIKSGARSVCTVENQTRPPVVGNEQAWRDHFVVAVLVFERPADSKEEPQSYDGFQQQYRRQRAAVTFYPPNPAV